MSFTNLSTDLQTLLLVQHSYTTKWFLFLTIILLSSFYVFVLWNKHIPTKYFSVAFARIMLYTFSVSWIVASPLLLILMTPEYTFLDFFKLPLIFYSIFIAIMGVVVFVDFMRYGIFVILKMAGMDMKDKNVTEIAHQMENSKHFLKWGHKKK